MRLKLNKESYATLGIILTLAWPTIVEQLMQTAVQYIDTAMVGVLGTQATASVGATTTIGWLLQGSITAFSIGFLALIAKACGAEDKKLTIRAVSQAVIMTFVLGIFFTILPLSLSKYVPIWMQVDPDIQGLASRYFFVLYLPMFFRTATIMFGTVLRAAGDTKTPMKVGIMINIINIALNTLLIYETQTYSLLGMTITIPGLGMGVVGAAAASAIAFSIGGILITIALWKHPKVSPKGMKWALDWEILNPCIRVAFPNMLQRFGTSLGFVAFAAMINSLGEIATAAHTIANTVESAFYIPGYGMQTAAATLTGNAYGAKDNLKMKSLAKMFIPIEVFLMILSGGLLFIFAPTLMSLFSKNPEVIQLGSTVLRMVALSEPFYGFSIIVEGMMMGVGKTKQPFVYNIIGMWGVRIIGTFITTQLLGLNLIAAWACMICHNLMLFICYLFVYIKGSWNPLNLKEPI